MTNDISDTFDSGISSREESLILPIITAIDFLTPRVRRLKP